MFCGKVNLFKLSMNYLPRKRDLNIVSNICEDHERCRVGVQKFIWSNKVDLDLISVSPAEDGLVSNSRGRKGEKQVLR